MNPPPPVPGVADPAAQPPTVLVTGELVLAGGDYARGELQARWSNETADVTWSGPALTQLIAPPDRADACMLAIYIQQQAERLGAKVTSRQDKPFPAMDEVKA